MTMSGDKKRVLCWLPVVLLPAGNLAALLFEPCAFAPRAIPASLTGAVAEELFFRWLLLRTILLPRAKPALSVVLVSAGFAALHLLNLRNGTPIPYVLLQMLCAFCFSIWAGAVVWKKNSILIPLLAHVLLNLTAVTEGTLLAVPVSMIVLADGVFLMKGNRYE